MSTSAAATSTATVTAVTAVVTSTSMAPPVSSLAVDETTETKTTSCSCYCHIERKLASLCLKTGHVIGISQWRPSSGRCECALCLSRDELEERLARPEADRKMEGRNRQLQRHLVCTLGQLTREQSIMARGLAKSQRAFVARQRTRSRRQSCDQDDVISSSSNSNYFRAKSSLQQQQQQQQLLDSDKHSQSSKLSLKFKNFNNGVNPHTTSDTNFNSH